ncbi:MULTISPECIES: YaaC family protein [unclassified Peribacillus]|uniref:YaaC family protein n=1 Tax=unclassified Peribacillus TaxID=2675266 RepID=UPI0019146E5E|nr:MULTISPECIES: YaaC family protein [unclassified Peribacillus]MBK5444282.1 YaaC family protein [Peribacillus sp. TH24]MBK5461013.1 YaaC family protein [Peribacillus sp. TH27]MBK5499155.1 YaaC family protein [Peribacillus sp. TH14]WMX55757.1 YaaC family protein [Peribacillus sp. R9-11]
MPENNDNFDKYTPFFSASSSQLFLQKCYTHEKIEDAEIKSYENCYPFIYHLEHAKTYYKQAAIAPLSIQPILSFYGFTQLLKACLLTIDPNYPESTSLLAHGVTTRKRKKQQYDFLKDEVKTQKNGLFTCIAEKIFNLKHMEGEKFSMETLLKEIPDMQSLAWNISRKNFIPLLPSSDGFQLPSTILDSYQMTSSRFEEFLTSKINHICHLTETPGKLLIQIDKVLVYNAPSPIRYNLVEEQFMLSLNKSSSAFLLPELLIHYLISYNLSIIARYETEWWAELMKTMPNDDYPCIVQFLKISQSKVPFLIFEWIRSERFNP